MHKRETIERVAPGLHQSAATIIRHCQSDEAGGYTPSDFPLAQLTREELDQVLVQPAAVEDIYRLSPMQEGMLFHSLYAPHRGLYFEQVQNRFEGEFEVKGLEAAWQPRAGAACDIAQQLSLGRSEFAGAVGSYGSAAGVAGGGLA